MSKSIATVSNISKCYGALQVFSNLSLTISQQDRVGIVGPNGSGKSSLLRVIAGDLDVDGGQVLMRKGLRVSLVSQKEELDNNKTALEICEEVAKSSVFGSHDWIQVARNAIASVRLHEIDQKVELMSGGQRKRLQIALGLCELPDLLLLDEPTNHLDLSAILDLERMLARSEFAWVLISHDRCFLNNVAGRVVEVNNRYRDGVFVVDGNYKKFAEKREQFLEIQAKQRQSLENRVRNEKAWLQKGVKARGTKAKGRIDSANRLIGELEESKSREAARDIKIDFSSSNRKTKQLVELEGVSKSYGELKIVSELSVKLLSGSAWGILGDNGVGKSTLVKLITKEIAADSGRIRHANNLSISYFSQLGDEQSDTSNIYLKDFLSDSSDSVVFGEETIHVASWAGRFHFGFEQLNQPFSTLSGGERARARLARLMLEKPDLLVLDEPTNDLDIDLIELLEDSLKKFEGVLVLVSHDRFMIENVCESFIGFDGKGGCKVYASYSQWERECLRRQNSSESSGSKKDTVKEPKRKKRSLSYLETKEYETIESDIEDAELNLAELQEQLGCPSLQSDSEALQELCLKIEGKQKEVGELYARWGELEEKKNSGG
ncbi:hypothetical protein BVY02_00160 [bacterium J17]|nr:hypothetical protein BVY02_00160 [bacterium J17]